MASNPQGAISCALALHFHMTWMHLKPVHCVLEDFYIKLNGSTVLDNPYVERLPNAEKDWLVLS
jgi:hypothetical protein